MQQQSSSSRVPARWRVSSRVVPIEDRAEGVVHAINASPIPAIGKRVVELGSGTGLAGLACAAAGASHVRGQSFQPPSLARLGTVLSGEPLHPPCR